MTEHLGYIDELGRGWREKILQDLAQSPHEWMLAFPEMEKRVNELLLEAELEKENVEARIKSCYEVLENCVSDKIWRLIYDEYIIHAPGKRLIELKKKIGWYRRALYQEQMSRRCDNLTETDIEIARESRIENLINENPRRMGGNLVFCCPFHDEKSPSFTVFQDNHFHCFGCGQHGDSIDFLMLRDKMPFPQAVKFLLGAK